MYANITEPNSSESANDNAESLRVHSEKPGVGVEHVSFIITLPQYYLVFYWFMNVLLYGMSIFMMGECLENC
jgi:hypothetical protein